MAIALIHIPREFHGPAGVWWIDSDDKLACYYTNDAPIQATVRARVALAARGNDVPLETWFRRLADRVPYADDYEVTDVQTGESPDAVLTRARQAWTTP